MDAHTVMWIVFGVIIATVLALDLFVLHKKPHAVSLREAMLWSGAWITIALIYGGVVWLLPAESGGSASGLGPVVAQRYLAGYVIELALSVDNLFVFAVIFAALGIKREYQHKLLFWGVFGALVLRALFIFAGVELIARFHWLMYIFGGILVFTGIKLLFQGDKELDPKKSLVIRAASRVLPVKPEIGGPSFWVKIDGRWYATMLFVGLILVEFTDVVFAIDSIPAVLTVAIDPETKKADPLVVYASNAFAIMGLRSLYFALAGIMAAFRFLKYGLAVILTFVGIKMIGMLGIPPAGIEPFKVPIHWSLAFIGGVLAVTIVLSLAIRKKVELPAEIKVEPLPQPAEKPAA
ncbi:MAG: TerC family protein [Planctomycetes bacterium]|nr:TerC family protein [Planctomycetota bacterium]